MKRLIVIYFISCTTNAWAHFLHIDDLSFALNKNKTTRPALAISIDGTTFYGALYTGTAPDKTLHINHGDSYWLGQNCKAGTYSDTGVSQCRNCTIGHYCPGGIAHIACTYGAISCPGTNYSTDPTMPSGAPINQLMTMDEVNKFIPVTDYSDWKEISCCASQNNNATASNPASLNNAQNACTHGTIGPGTYLFVARYVSASLLTTNTDSVNGNEKSITNASIAIFDHTVSYASIHGNSIYQHFIDTEHTTYTEYTFSTAPVGGWLINQNNTNILNLTEIPAKFLLCVYELK